MERVEGPVVMERMKIRLLGKSLLVFVKRKNRVIVLLHMHGYYFYPGMCQGFIHLYGYKTQPFSHATNPKLTLRVHLLLSNTNISHQLLSSPKSYTRHGKKLSLKNYSYVYNRWVIG